MDLELKEKIISISGGIQGSGGAISYAVAKVEGFPVIIGRIRKIFGSRLHERNLNRGFIQGDCMKSAPAEKVVEETVNKFG